MPYGTATDYVPGVILIAPDRELAEQFKTVFVEPGAIALRCDFDAYPELDVLLAHVNDLTPIVVIDVSTDVRAALDAVHAIGRKAPQSVLIALNRTGDPDLLLDCLRAGFREFFSVPLDRTEQVQALGRLFAPEQVRREPDRQPATVIAFQSAKRGSGATSVAIQTAFGLAKRLGERVLFLDLDFAGTTIRDWLAAETSATVIDYLVRGADWCDLVRTLHCIDVLPGPAQPHCERLERGELERLLVLARARYEWVVVDVPSDGTQPASAEDLGADHYFLVMGLDPGSLYVARMALHRLERFGVDDEHLRLVPNKTARGDLSARQLKELLACPAFVRFPIDSRALKSAAEGSIPVNALTPFGKAVDEMVRRLDADRRERGSASRTHSTAARRGREVLG